MKQAFTFLLLFISIGIHAEVPRWFLHPAKGEYVGVSLPNDKNTAIVSALLTYAVQNSAKATTTTTFLYPIEYSVVRQSSNEKGETFVSIHVNESTTDTLSCQISTHTSQGISNNDQPISWEQITICKLSYKKEIGYILQIRDDSSQQYPEITCICQRKGSEKYAACVKEETLHYANQATAPTGLGWSISCTQSLHYAYMRALIGTLSHQMHIAYPLSIRDNQLIMNVKTNTVH